MASHSQLANRAVPISILCILFRVYGADITKSVSMGSDSMHNRAKTLVPGMHVASFNQPFLGALFIL